MGQLVLFGIFIFQADGGYISVKLVSRLAVTNIIRISKILEQDYGSSASLWTLNVFSHGMISTTENPFFNLTQNLLENYIYANFSGKSHKSRSHISVLLITGWSLN